MKIIFLLVVIAVLAYTSGLLFEVIAEGEQSKLQTLADTGKFNPDWMPFLLKADLYKINNLVDRASVEYSDIPKFVKVGHMWVEEVTTLETANVSIDIGVNKVTIGNKNVLQNVVDKCIFHSPDNFEPLCLICRVLNSAGEVIGEGGFAENVPYSPSQPIEIDVFPISQPQPSTGPLSNDVQEVEGVEITICLIPEGCTPGFWKNNFGAWSGTGFSPTTKFSSAFMLTANQKQVIVKFFGKDITLGEAISRNGGGLNALVRHATAALLSEATEGISYLLTMNEIKTLVQDALQAAYNGNNSLIEPAKNILANANEQDCPLAADESGKTFDDEQKPPADEKGPKKK